MKKFIFILITIFLLAASSAQGIKHHPKNHKHHIIHHHAAKQTAKPKTARPAISTIEPETILSENYQDYSEEEENKIYSPREEENNEMLSNSTESEVTIEEEN